MNLRNALAGFAIQTAKGTRATQPAWAGPVGGGKLLAIEVEQAEDELTSAQVGSPGEYRKSAAFSGEYEYRMWPASIGALLYAVLGAIQTTGTTAPYTHTITPDGDLPWCTVFGAKDTERKSFADCKLDELKLEWEGNDPVKVTPAWLGLSVAWSASAYTPALDETNVPYLKGIDLSACTIDLDGTGKDGGAVVQGGSVDIKRNLTADSRSGQIEPVDASEGLFECDVELKCRVPDLALVRLLLTGSLTGTSVSPTVPYGDLSLTFTATPTVVTLSASKVAWKAAEPDADPRGGPGEVTLQGRCYGDTPLSATVVNAVASY